MGRKNEYTVTLILPTDMTALEEKFLGCKNSRGILK